MRKVEYIDLSELTRPHSEERCEICIVGAGAAGIYLAVKLANQGLDVIVLEAGKTLCAEASEVGFEAEFTGEVYSGATKGRAFGLGGTTSLWGGALMPHTRHDLRPSVNVDIAPWPTIVQRVSEKSNKVLMALGRNGGVDFSLLAQESLGNIFSTFSASDLDVLSVIFLPFRHKNMAFLLNSRLAGDGRLRVYTNAVAKLWNTGSGLDPDSTRIETLAAVSGDGKTLHVNASRFVIAAGAIESARILLELDSRMPIAIVRSTSLIGCNLSDHLSASIADVKLPDRNNVAQLFSPCFSKGWMQNFRFLETDSPDNSPRAFAHFIFDNENPGFVLAKNVLSALQSRHMPLVSPAEVAKGIKGLLALAYTRYVHSKLYISPNTNVHLQLDIEQRPSRNNRVTLGRETDRYGRQITVIDWRISDVDINDIQTTAERVLRKWPGAGKGLPDLIRRDVRCDSTKPYDTYHPVGTCRMGEDVEAVVDLDLKVWGLENMWVISTGVLPTAGTANPTFTMLCLAETLAQQLAISVGLDQ